MFWAKEGTVSYSIRPAIHLNLTLAEQSKATSIDVPDEFSVNYNTSEQGAEEQSWYADINASLGNLSGNTNALLS